MSEPDTRVWRSADVQTTVLGLTRAYQTRHGAGPFPTEDEGLTAALPDPHNPTNAWQGAFHAGWLDLALLRYAIDACGGQINGLVMTCLDRISDLPEAKFGVDYASEESSRRLESTHGGDLERREADGQRLRTATVEYAPTPRRHRKTPCPTQLMQPPASDCLSSAHPLDRRLRIIGSRLANRLIPSTSITGSLAHSSRRQFGARYNSIQSIAS